MEIKQSREKPAVFDRIKSRFPFITDKKWEEGVIVAYGDTVYCSKDISEDLKVHEAVHLKQQEGIDKDVFWDRYLSDDRFRFEMEKEAYAAQIKWINHNVRDKNKRFEMKRFHINNFCSPMYGSLIERADAWKLLDIK